MYDYWVRTMIVALVLSALGFTIAILADPNAINMGIGCLIAAIVFGSLALMDRQR